MIQQVENYIKACKSNLAQLVIEQTKNPSDDCLRAINATKGMIEDFQKELKCIRSI